MLPWSVDWPVTMTITVHFADLAVCCIIYIPAVQPKNHSLGLVGYSGSVSVLSIGSDCTQPQIHYHMACMAIRSNEQTFTSQQGCFTFPSSKPQQLSEDKPSG